jgi:hypothetical protein
MTIVNYPTLNALRQELESLAAAQRMLVATEARTRTRLGKGQRVYRVDWCDGSHYWLTEPQRRVVVALLEALGSASPEVDQRTLIRASGVQATRLIEVFPPPCEAWGKLIVEGKRAGHYRLPDPPEVVEDCPRLESEA